MAITYKLTTTRPSLNDAYWFEPFAEFCRLSFTNPIYGLFDGQPGYLGFTLVNPITWDELFVRKQELRMDLQLDLDTCTNIDTAIPPLYNPFEVTSAVEFNFSNLEDFTAAYDAIIQNGTDRWPQLHAFTNNTVLEQVFADGVQIEFPTKF